MVDISRFNINEVVGTAKSDNFAGKTNTAFFGARGNDTFRAAETAPLLFGFDEGQAFFGGRGSDTYLIPNGTSTIVDDSGGSGGDTLVATWIARNAEDTYAAEFDNRHLGIVDESSRTIIVVLDWLDPARAIERVEIADGVLRLGQDLTARDVRGDENYLGNFSLAEAGSLAGFGPDLVAFTQDGINALLARSDELDTRSPATPPGGGTAGDDRLIGDRSDDVLDGRGGNDRIEGRSGNDVLTGGAGADLILGGGGNDRASGGGGDDTIRVGGGADEASGGSGSDEIQGGAGRDSVSGGAGPDLLSGGGGNDRLLGGGGQDTVRGGPGDDEILGGGRLTSCPGGRTMIS